MSTELQSESKSISDPSLNIVQNEESMATNKILMSKSIPGKLIVDYDTTSDKVESTTHEKHSNSEIQSQDASSINNVMSTSVFDDNGNPMDDDIDIDDAEFDVMDASIQDGGDGDHGAVKQKEDESGIYFINAAAVSDDEGIEYMAGSRSGDTFVNNSDECQTKPKSTEKQVKNDESFVLFEKIKRSRVPISRSYPDIIQTTMTEKFFKIDPSTLIIPIYTKVTTVNKATSNQIEFVPTDSLEELVEPAVLHQNQVESERQNVTKKPEPRFNLDGSQSNLLLSSSIGGISCEKPPDSWTIDFNSLSIEEAIFTESSSGPRSSNSNSLAFFVDMNEAIPEDESKKVYSNYDDPKKIFSMFVDIGEKQKLATDTKSCAKNSSIIPEARATETSYYAYKKHITTNPKASNPGSKISKWQGPTASRESGGNRNGLPESKNVSNQIPPNLMTLSNRSSLHVANHDLEDIFAQSLMSSMETSGPDEDLESCLKLGMDLMRMFQEGINTDVQISVNGRFIKAHKCILASRSQYFAAILSGNMIEVSGNTIHLDEFSFSVVQFTLYYIYSGTNEIPDSIDLIELTTLTDLLGLEGLREIIGNTIKVKFAHNFHRPCSTCIIGVIQFFPITITYGMDELCRKMTKWISKHFVRIWPTKAFASLGDDLIEKCLSYTINHLSGENLLDITLGCDQLLNTMPNIKWAETIFSIVNQLTEACTEFVGLNFCQVLQSQRFLIFGKGQAWNISRIENTFMEGLKLLKPDDACLSHVCLTRLIELGTRTFDEAFVDFLIMLQNEVEKYLLANASRAVLSKNWERLSENVRKKICSTGFLGYDKSGKKTPTTGKNTASSQQVHRVQETKSTRPTSSSSTRTSSATMTKSSWKAGQKSAELLDLSPPSSHSARQILSPTESSKGAKVASVRPMPSQVQHQNVYSSRQTSKPPDTRSTSKVVVENPVSGRRPVAKPLTQRQLTRNERERSFDNSPTSSSGSYSNQVPSQSAGTPMTPSRPNSFPYRNTKLSPRLDDKPTAPAKPVFLTNSEKAKAVSKPLLKPMRTSRSNSVCATTSSVSTTPSAAHSRQSSIGSNIQNAPRTPNLSQQSRYASSSMAVRKPLDKIAQSITNSPRSPAPQPRVNSGNAARRTADSMASVSNTGRDKPRGVVQRDIKGNNSNRGSGRSKVAKEFDSESDSDNLMTKSNIEVDVSSSNGETRQRTLAEIGRSSTFSKDEPTVLGKMDLSLDMDYNEF